MSGMTQASLRIGIAGVGAMGSCFAQRLLDAGHDVALLPHNDMARITRLVEHGATTVTHAAELAERADFVITSLPDVPQVAHVLFGTSGLAEGARPGLLFIDMSTITPGAAREHHSRLADIGVQALDAPVSGGPVRAADGTLTIMVGGDEQPFARALPVLEHLGKHIRLIGPPGSGQAVKLVNQLLISIVMVANAEALTLGVHAGIPLETITDVVGTSSGSNYLLSNWLPNTLFAGNASGFALDLLAKDLRAALAWAQEEGTPTFMGALAQQLYRLAWTPENARNDYSAVAQLYERAAGIELRMGAGDKE